MKRLPYDIDDSVFHASSISIANSRGLAACLLIYSADVSSKCIMLADSISQFGIPIACMNSISTSN